MSLRGYRSKKMKGPKSISSSVFLRNYSPGHPYSKNLETRKSSYCSLLACLDSYLTHRWRDRIRGRPRSPGRRRTCGSTPVPLSSSHSSVHGSHSRLNLRGKMCSLHCQVLWLLVDDAELQRLWTGFEWLGRVDTVFEGFDGGGRVRAGMVRMTRMPDNIGGKVACYQTP
jgi:hypothetical protein